MNETKDKYFKNNMSVLSASTFVTLQDNKLEDYKPILINIAHYNEKYNNDNFIAQREIAL